MSAARRDIRTFDRSLLAVCVILLGVTVIYPSARLLIAAVTDWRPEVIAEPAGRQAIVNTLVISLLSVAGAGFVGTTLAFLLTRYRFPGQRVLSGLAYMPFTLPPLVGVLSFKYIIGRDGFIPRWLAETWGWEDAFLHGPGAIWLIHTYSFYVFFYAMVSAALEGLDRSQIEAARTLGAGRLRVFFRVTLPLLRPSLVGAALLTFMSSGASFSAPLLFGDDYPMLTVRIFEERELHHDAEAATLTVVLALVALVGVLLFRSRKTGAGSASKGTPVTVKSTTGRFLAGAISALAVVAVLLPHITIAWLSFVDHRAWFTEIIPTTFTLENYTAIFSDARAFAPIRNSLWMSGLAAVATLAVSLPAAYLIARRRRGGRLINFIVMIPWALPGTVIAVNLIVAFNDPWLPLVGTVWLLPLAYFVRNVPLLTRMSAAAIEPFDAGLVEAAQTLGASRFYAFRRVVVPLIAPALAAATALVFATALGEFVASILLWVPANTPIAVQINLVRRGSGIGLAFAYSVFLMALVVTTFLLSRRFASRVV